MAQLNNPARLSLKITLGMQTEERNSVGVPVPSFKPVVTVHAGAWTRSLVQQYQLAGLGMTDTEVYVVRHRKSYEGITRVLIGEQAYQLVDEQIEPIPGPTAYDLLTVKKVTKHG
jgi:SPP1 family predicted phage head-tail adaptor